MQPILLCQIANKSHMSPQFINSPGCKIIIFGKLTCLQERSRICLCISTHHLIQEKNIWFLQQTVMSTIYVSCKLKVERKGVKTRKHVTCFEIVFQREPLYGSSGVTRGGFPWSTSSMLSPAGVRPVAHTWLQNSFKSVTERRLLVNPAQEHAYARTSLTWHRDNS